MALWAFTAEFFGIVRRAMSEGGVMVLAAPGSLTYYGSQLRELNACLLTTLRGGFGNVFTVPGDTNIYLASASPGVMHFLGHRMVRPVWPKRATASGA